MGRPHTEPGVRRIGLPDRTLRAVVETMPCPTCGAAIGHRCRPEEATMGDLPKLPKEAP